MSAGVYTGKTMTLVHGSVSLEGLRTVSLQDNAKGLAKMLDGTAATDATYQLAEDPMGSEGNVKATFTVTALDSKVGYADNKGVKIALNATGSLVFTTATTSHDNVATLAGAALLSRTTTIPYDEPATQDFTFSANANVTWSSVA